MPPHGLLFKIQIFTFRKPLLCIHLNIIFLFTSINTFPHPKLKELQSRISKITSYEENNEYYPLRLFVLLIRCLTFLLHLLEIMSIINKINSFFASFSSFFFFFIKPIFHLHITTNLKFVGFKIMF